MPARMIAQALLLPELKLLAVKYSTLAATTELLAEKKSEAEVCPRCATLSRVVYDRRYVRVKDEPLRNKHVVLRVRKRRFLCKPCKKPFTEPVGGIRKGRRTTERYRKALLRACERFVDL